MGSICYIILKKTNQEHAMDLITATIENNIDEVKRLLELGVDPNIYLDDAKLTPLHFAAQNNAIEIAMLLLEAGADPFASTSPDDETALNIANLHQHQQMVSLLVSYMSETESVQS